MTQMKTWKNVNKWTNEKLPDFTHKWSKKQTNAKHKQKKTKNMKTWKNAGFNKSKNTKNEELYQKKEEFAKLLKKYEKNRKNTNNIQKIQKTG